MKCVLVIDAGLPRGLAANAAAVLAATLGARVPDLVGRDLPDADGADHPGIVVVPLPVLAADTDALRELRQRAAAVPDLVCVDFSRLAQQCRRYDEYADLLAATPGQSLDYVGVGLAGPAKAVNKLTGSLPCCR